ncbi:MAG: LpxL/LpxP family Kdo(2)-lipid IV(A) lauroyl/palmitoleoyl acyltransferase [Gammaproteobacteria bacterium]|nr:MAG: LpxL/LpxP family Kdo(2)-lipid IV(A) lauroyl/palmitoleoyl acyltransferase [Gammaproteobacteria bacterium]
MKQVNSIITQFKPSSYLHPRYWATWLGIGLMRLVAMMPFAVQLFIGRRIGDLMRLLSPGRRQVARINLELCFPELDAGARQKLLRRSFQSAGISLTESALSWWGSEARLRRLYRLEGIEYLNDALQQGKGALLLGAHYTTLEISGRFLAFHTQDLQPIYKPARNILFNAVMVNSRRRLFDDLLLNRDMRTIIRNLKNNKVIWYAPDQDFRRAQTVFAPFMGIAAASLTMTSRLAKVSGAPVLPYYSQRLPGSQGYLIRLMPPLQDFPSGDDVTDMTRINQAIEQQVRAAPEQYLWLHRRFKTRPPGEKELYPPK